MTDRTPLGVGAATLEDWLRAAGEVRESSDGITFIVTSEALQDYAEWVAAAQREAIAVALESLPERVAARTAAGFIRRLRGEH